MATPCSAAVVNEFGAQRGAFRSRNPRARPGPGPGQAGGHRRLPHRPARGQGDWPVKPTPPFIPGHEGVRQRRAVGRGRHRPQGRRHGGQRLAWSACGRLRILPHRLGDPVRAAAERRLLRQRLLRRVHAGGRRFAARIPEGADPVEIAPVLCAGVTVYKGLKVTEARPGPVGGDLRDRRAGAHCRAVRQGHGPAGRGRGHRRRKAGAGQANTVPRYGQRPQRGSGRRGHPGRPAAPTACWSPRCTRRLSARPSA